MTYNSSISCWYNALKWIHMNESVYNICFLRFFFLEEIQFSWTLVIFKFLGNPFASYVALHSVKQNQHKKFSIRNILTGMFSFLFIFLKIWRLGVLIIHPKSVPGYGIACLHHVSPRWEQGTTHLHLTYSGITYNPVLFPGFIRHRKSIPTTKIQTVVCLKDHSSSSLGY